MAIEHSEALGLIEQFSKSMEPKHIRCDIPGMKPVFAHPLSVQQVDSLNAKYERYEYQLRLLMMSLRYEDGSRVFMDTDFPRLYNSSAVGVVADMAAMVASHLATDFDSIKNS